MSETNVRASFYRQAEACAELGSPFTATLCRLLGDRLEHDTPVGRKVFAWQGDPGGTGGAVALRLCGALHGLVLENVDAGLAAVYPASAATIAEPALWQAVERALIDNDAFVLERLKSPPQTNEVRRSAALVPGFLAIAATTGKPLVLSEIGASSGINLCWDQYRYRLGDLNWGNADANVVLEPQWDGPSPPDAKVTVQQRRGCDLNPLDAGDPADRLRLLSYIWPDQHQRLERTRYALEVAAKSDAIVDRADAADWLEQRLAMQIDGATHVLFHSITWQYLPSTVRIRVEAAIAAAAARANASAPFAHLQMEADDQSPGAGLSLTIWPGGERRAIGRTDYHGRWVDWSGFDLTN